MTPLPWERSALYRYLRYLWTYRFTAGGKWVVAGLLFSQNLDQAGLLLRSLEGFGLFCLLSSAVYLINDVRDRGTTGGTRTRVSGRSPPAWYRHRQPSASPS